MVDEIEKAREDQKATILYYKDEGRAEGKAEGKAESREEIARNLARMNLSIDQIQQATGLGNKEIEELK